MIIIEREYALDNGNISSIANSYVCVANVSKLNGLKINVIGSSFIISIKVNINALISANLFIGR
jgi:hypothetical protein